MTTADQLANVIVDYLDGTYDEDLCAKIGAGANIADGLDVDLYRDGRLVEQFEVHVLPRGVSAN